MFAHYLTSLFLAVRRDFIGRMAVRRCCAGFSAGAGLDDGAMEELLRMGRPVGEKLFIVQGSDFAGHITALRVACQEDEGEYDEPSFFAPNY